MSCHVSTSENFDDGNSTGWTAHAGTWAISNTSNVGNSYRQSNSTHTATNSSRALSQSGSMAFEWEVTFESGIAAAGIHLFASEASSSNHGNSYLVWQHATKLMIYKSSGNNLVLQTSTPLSNANGQTHRYKVTYNPANGQFAAWRDGVAVLNWTDSNAPYSSGSYIALRTSKSVVRFDNIRITGNPATNSTLHHLYGDHLGSTSVLANSSGQVVDKTYYLPFGEYRRGDSSILTASGFTGHLHNDTLGLIYMNARFYSPSSGRFISADTIVPLQLPILQPLLLHPKQPMYPSQRGDASLGLYDYQARYYRYAYVLGNPPQKRSWLIGF